MSTPRRPRIVAALRSQPSAATREQIAAEALADLHSARLLVLAAVARFIRDNRVLLAAQGMALVQAIGGEPGT